MVGGRLGRRRFQARDETAAVETGQTTRSGRTLYGHDEGDDDKQQARRGQSSGGGGGVVIVVVGARRGCCLAGTRTASTKDAVSTA